VPLPALTNATILIIKRYQNIAQSAEKEKPFPRSDWNQAIKYYVCLFFEVI